MRPRQQEVAAAPSPAVPDMDPGLYQPSQAPWRRATQQQSQGQDNCVLPAPGRPRAVTSGGGSLAKGSPVIPSVGPRSMPAALDSAWAAASSMTGVACGGAVSSAVPVRNNNGIESIPKTANF